MTTLRVLLSGAAIVAAGLCAFVGLYVAWWSSLPEQDVTGRPWRWFVVAAAVLLGSAFAVFPWRSYRKSAGAPPPE
jgi:hypothetical protein